jgi:SH3-like domain-containing protein
MAITQRTLLVPVATPGEAVTVIEGSIAWGRVIAADGYCGWVLLVSNTGE